MSNSPLRRFEYSEPACWGSNELPLIPVGLSKVLESHRFQLRQDQQAAKRRDRKPAKVTFSLQQFAVPGWANDLRGLLPLNDDETTGEVILREISKACEQGGDAIDIPILPYQVHGMYGIDSIPLRVTTLEDLHNAQLQSSEGLSTVLSGTYREAFQRLGTWESVLDVVITSLAWENHLIGLPSGFLQPHLPPSLSDLVGLLRVRYGRNSGVARQTRQDETRLFEAIGGRFGIDLEGQWTLQMCGDHANVTRERIRQIEKTLIWPAWPRRWPSGDLLEPALNAIHGLSRDAIIDFVDVSGHKHQAIHSEQIRLLARIIGQSNDYRLGPTPTATEKFSSAGVTPHELKDAAFQLSKRMGFVHIFDLEMTLASILGHDHINLLKDALELVSTFGILSNGYVYVDGNRTSFTFNSLESLLSLYGPQEVEEAYGACRRNAIYRATAEYPFPPVAVFEEWLTRDRRFKVKDGIVEVVEPVAVELGQVQGWMKSVIESSPGSVIHRTTLYEFGRQHDVRPGTLNVYCSYNPYFKGAGSNCITLTGLKPSPEAIRTARAIAAQYQVRNEFLGFELNSGILRVRVIIGTELCDAGLFGFPRAIRQLLGNVRYRALVDGNQHGHISISGTRAIGFSTALTFMEAVPGDHVEVAFDLREETATFEYLSLLNVDLGQD